MAEIDINQAHSHDYQRYTSGGGTLVIKSPTIGDCAVPHTDCLYTFGSHVPLLLKSSVGDTSGALGKRTGEIKANPSHTHTYTGFHGTMMTDARWLSSSDCPSAHTICHNIDVYSYSSIVEEGHDDSYGSGEAQASAEINLNYAHQHSYNRNLVRTLSRPWTNCALGHDQCRSAGALDFIKNTFGAQNFDSERLL